MLDRKDGPAGNADLFAALNDGAATSGPADATGFHFGSSQPEDSLRVAVLEVERALLVSLIACVVYSCLCSVLYKPYHLSVGG